MRLAIAAARFHSGPAADFKPQPSGFKERSMSVRKVDCFITESLEDGPAFAVVEVE